MNNNDERDSRIRAEVLAARVVDRLHAADRDPLEVLAVHEVLDRLAEHAPRKAELVKLRYFLGCTVPEAAAVLGIAPATAEEDWTYARAWLRRRWRRGEKGSA